jgi:tRNA A37 methylthiotransferase MiaB
LADRAPGAEVRERARRTRDIGAALTARFRAAQIGTLHRALTLDDGTVAVTGNYLKATIPRGHRRNEWVTLRVTEVRGGVLMGEVVAAPTISRDAESSAPAPA